MEEKFHPSLTSRVFLVLALVSQVLVSIVVYGTSPHGIGAITGGFVFSLAFCSGIGYGVWRLSGRNQKSGSNALAVAAAFIALSQVGLVSNSLPDRHVQEIKQAKEQLQAHLESGDGDLESIERAQSDYADVVTEQLDEVAAKSTGKKAEVFAIVSAFTKETAAQAQTWRDANSAVMAPEILDFGHIEKSRDYKTQVDTLSNYIEATRKYKQYVMGGHDALRERLRPIGLGDKNVIGVLKGYKEGFDGKSAVLSPLLDAHIAYGQSMLEIVNFLREIDGQWSQGETGPTLSTDAQVVEFNRLMEEIGVHEAELLRLDQELVKLG